jgi:hypothetical protein
MSGISVDIVRECSTDLRTDVEEQSTEVEIDSLAPKPRVPGVTSMQMGYVTVFARNCFDTQGAKR